MYVYNKDELTSWFDKSQNFQDFVIQEEIIPSLYGGRKFVIRSHILICQRNLNETTPLETYLHKKSIIVQHHSSL